MIIINRTSIVPADSTDVQNNVDFSVMKIVPDLRVFEAANVSRETSRKRIQDLVALGTIEPKRTPTGSCLLSFEDAERLVNAL